MGLGIKCLQTPAPDLVQSVHDRGLDFSSLRKATPKEATTPGFARRGGPMGPPLHKHRAIRNSDDFYHHFAFGLSSLRTYAGERFMSMSLQNGKRITTTGIITSTRITCLLEAGIG